MNSNLDWIAEDFVIEDEGVALDIVEEFERLRDDDDAVADLINRYGRADASRWHGLAWWERRFARAPHRIPMTSAEQFPVFVALNHPLRLAPRLFRPDDVGGIWYTDDGAQWQLSKDGRIEGGPLPAPRPGTSWRVHQALGDRLEVLYSRGSLTADNRLLVSLDADDASLRSMPFQGTEQRWRRDPPDEPDEPGVQSPPE